MNAVEAGGNYVMAPNSARVTRAFTGRDPTAVERDGHVVGCLIVFIVIIFITIEFPISTEIVGTTCRN